jgi:fatty-acyl-CoA synthase
MLAEWEWPSPPHVLPSAPLSHAGGAMTLTTLLKQGTLFVQPKFDALGVLQAVQEHRINTLLLVPTMIYQLLDHPGFAEFDLSSLQTIFYGASAISPARSKEAIERIGPVFFQFYGQAEAPMTITVNLSEAAASRICRLTARDRARQDRQEGHAGKPS